MNPPPLGTSISLGLRAAAREGWLLPVSALLSVLRSAAPVPAVAVAVLLPLEGATGAMRRSPFSYKAPFEGAWAVMGSTRYLALVGGLLLAAILVGALLRVLFLAGALPTLGASMAGVDATRRFAPGIAWGLPRQLATWSLAALADLAAAGYVLVAAAAALGAAGVARAGHPVLLAILGAAVIATGLVLIVAARVVGDAAAARCAILGEGAGMAFAGATRRLLARPGAFLIGGLAVGLAGLAATAALQPAAGILGTLGGRLDGVALLGPQWMLAAFAALAAAAVDLAWLATVGALACAEEVGERR